MDYGRGLVGVPHTGQFHWQAVSSLLTMSYPANTAIILHGFSLIHDAREALARATLEKGFDWLLFIDSDMVIPNDTIERLLAWEQPIVGTLAFKRSPPHQCCSYESVKHDGEQWRLKALRDWQEGLQPVAGTGMACTLIRREALEAIPRPWFWPEPGLGEDLGFCAKAKKHGIKIYVDTTLDVRHLSTSGVGREHFRACLEAREKQEVAG